MKQIFIFLFVSLLSSNISAQKSISDMSFGTDSTLDIMTWNIEHFPKNGETTLDYVEQIILALDIDIVAFQEINDVSSFDQMLADMPDYAGDYHTTSYGDYALAYIYKKDLVQNNGIFAIYTGETYIFPRAPFVFDFTFMGENFRLIDNHLKAMSDDESVSRRLEAINTLKNYIDNYCINMNVILLGDLNDELTDGSDNVFQSILDDTQNYLFADMDIAEGSSAHWSYPTWPSHLDHILITNELFDEFSDAGSIVQTMEIDNYLSGWSEYDNNVSDHRPVAIRFLPNLNVGIEDIVTNLNFTNYPNPCNTETKFVFNSINNQKILEIFNFNGQKVYTETINSGQNSVICNTENFPEGIYFARLLTDNEKTANLKFVVKR